MSGTEYKPVDTGQDGKYVTAYAVGNISLGNMVAIDTGNSSDDYVYVKSGTDSLKALGLGIAATTRETRRLIANNNYQTANDGEVFTVLTKGVAYANANGTITVGDSLQLDDGGQLTQGTDNAIATAMANASDGENVKVLLLGRTW